MIDRTAISRYDDFVSRPRGRRLETVDVRVGVWGRARILRVKENSTPIDAEFDVVVAGGGPAGVLHGCLLAKQGHSVLIVERKDELGTGVTWNVSHEEYADLGKTQAFTPEQWTEMAVGDYQEGIFRIFDRARGEPRDFHFDEICNISVDERTFFRCLLENHGPKVWTGCTAALSAVTPTCVLVDCCGAKPSRRVRARLFIDARGWASPLAGLVHPARETESVFNVVGVHTSKLPRETSPETGRPIGLIAATYEDEIGTPPVQPILERFSQYVPGRNDGGEVLYYFTRTATPDRLAPLVDPMLHRLHHIVRGFSVNLVSRTYYGHIPGYYPDRPFSGWTSRSSAGDRTLLLGCAAGQYSGLTGCAFGALLRNAESISQRLDRLLRTDRLSFRALRSIDIDPRERLSQALEELFGGSMELDAGEPLGTVNRDWILFMEAVEGMDARCKNEAFRDKIPLATLNQLAGITVGNRDLFRALLRNNHGHVATVLWTFLSTYARLLAREAVLLATRRRYRYLSGSARALVRLPQFLTRNLHLYEQGRGIGRMQSGKG
jgi:2-polyprenyl-6-methoxyphenol hydroxylase-like FAD-dependent oxidoreductase